ncbi:MAG: 4'-phosphopantetheinyl transferase superfamily protein [Oscillospiraceae bacterium]|nr:4'-phosphopantetheinyl transferase superfamily protein [Oscillospiraceae bacterium]
MNLYLRTFKTRLALPEQREMALRLLDYALREEYGILRRPEMTKTPSGKPYFKDSSIFFNYSHCRLAAACAVSRRGAVGVDAECGRAVSTAAINRVCIRSELSAIENGGDFLRIWTQKEAYAKFTGRGFAERFRRIDTSAFPPSRVFERETGAVKLFVACYYEGDEDCNLIEL